MKSYLRFLFRNKLYTTIEMVGLSVSLAFVIIMSCFVWQNISVNRHYPDQDRMYAIGTKGSLMSNAGDTSSIPGGGTKTPYASRQLSLSPLEPAPQRRPDATK